VAHNFIEVLIKSLPIEFGVDEKRRWIKVKDAIELDIEAVAGGDKNRDSVIVNSPFSVVPGVDMTIARSSKYNYSDHGMEWNNSGKTASIVDSSIHRKYIRS
jgi:hypothetical protein